MQDPNYKLKKDEGTTRGIDVFKWSFPMEDGKIFQVNIWDFGGQQIYHSTHQFFLTKRSMYILVSDNRREDADFHYWLNIVELLGGESPLIIVQNEMQERYRQISAEDYKGRFRNLKEVFDINLSKNLAESRDWKKTIDSIKYYISGLDHVGDPLPRTWTRIREKLYELRNLEENPCNYIDIREYLSICEENGIARKEDRLQLSGYLHDLGVCLHFQDDPILRNTVILNPEWATDAVYKILDDEDVNRSFGRFNKADIESICNGSAYDDMHDCILRLMLRFGLCYEIPNNKDRYIAPQLLSVDKPKYDWDEKENIIIRYTYKFMPKGIISRFIVAMHENIYNDSVWRRGVVLEKYETKAEVIENYEEKEIKIRVTGKHKKELMTIVTNELEKIHGTFNNLRYEMQVPCNCPKCKDSQNPHFYSFDILMKFEGDGEYNIQCQNSYKMVNILNLINDVISKPVLRDHKGEPQVFISYLHENGEKVRKLCDELESYGIKVWLDNNDLKPGCKWQGEIEGAINTVDFFIACFSKEYWERDQSYMNVELRLAVEKMRSFHLDKKWFIPVLLSECKVPDFKIGSESLLGIQQKKLYEDWDDGILEIVRVIMG